MIRDVIIERVGEVLRFTLNRPEQHNEITGDMFNEMLAVLKQEKEQPTSRILHIRANGKDFCLGRERAARTPGVVRFEVERLVRFKQMLRQLPLITVAEVHGDAMGFGFGMSIVCDFVFAAQGVKLGFPEIQMGLAPAAIMSYLGEYTLPRHAFSLVVTGQPITPERAVEIGLISESVALDHLAVRTQTLIDSIMQLDPQAIRNCKEFFQTTLQNNFEQNLRLSIDSLTVGSLEMMAKN